MNELELKMIWQAYKRLFCVIYQWQKKMWGDCEPEQWALLGISFIFFLNFYTLCMFAVFLGFHFIGSVITSNIFYYPFGVAILVAHYFLFIRKGKYKKIIREYEKMKFSEEHDIAVFLGYLLFSFVCLGASGILMVVSLKTGFTVIGSIGKLFY